MPSVGRDLQGGDEEARRAGARAMGSARTPAKIAAVRQNIEKAIEARRGKPMSEAHKAAARAAQQARREREKTEREEQARLNPPPPKRPRGRPKKTE